ncbi:MAG: GtrA family protein [Oscillospiraceae bacterium]|nr:GtrA family protein [Oscillospiraceae bacterium]
MKKTTLWQMVKFTLFSASAALIELGSFALINELLHWSYWPAYLTALTLSVLWNFTLNRRYTFQSAANVPVAMAKVLGFYLVFTPLSTWLGHVAESAGINEYLVLIVTMLANFVLEFLFCKLVVYRNQENTRIKKGEN